MLACLTEQRMCCCMQRIYVNRIGVMRMKQTSVAVTVFSIYLTMLDYP